MQQSWQFAHVIRQVSSTERRAEATDVARMSSCCNPHPSLAHTQHERDGCEHDSENGAHEHDGRDGEHDGHEHGCENDTHEHDGRDGEHDGHEHGGDILGFSEFCGEEMADIGADIEGAVGRSPECLGRAAR